MFFSRRESSQRMVVGSETHGWSCCDPQASRRPHNRTNGGHETSPSDAGPRCTTPSVPLSSQERREASTTAHQRSKHVRRPCRPPSRFPSQPYSHPCFAYERRSWASPPRRHVSPSPIAIDVDRAARAALSEGAWERVRARGKVLGCAGKPWRTHGPCTRPGGLAKAPVGSEARKVRARATRRRRPRACGGGWHV